MSGLLHPLYWPIWLGFGLLRLLALLPYRPLMALGRLLGRVVYLLAKRRRHIAETNLRLCFPEWTGQQIQAMLKKYFVSVGMGLMGFLVAWWWWPHKKIAHLYEAKGLEHAEAAFAAGKGVIFYTVHMSSAEMAGRLLAHHTQAVPLYRPHHNPVVHHVILGLRERRLGKTIPRDDVRMMIRKLRANQGVWFAPDQNYGHKNSLFVDFFGVPAATTTATSRFAAMTGAKVVPYITLQRPQGGYQIIFEAPLENFPSGDDRQDIQRLHQIAEHWIRQAPEQYNWMHRRFKDRPNDEPRFY